jgi:F-type H+-transporting ATPase subunit k
MGVLGSIFGGVFLATGGSKKPLIHQTPPFNAKDKNEEDFIQYVGNNTMFPQHESAHRLTVTASNRNFLKESEGAQKAAKH